METLRGKQTSFMDSSGLAHRIASYQHIHIDIGTGDGRFVRETAQTCPQHFIIGIDACRENLYETSRRTPDNAVFVIANARELPTELYGLAHSISINFPWGSLLEGLLNGDPMLLTGLAAIARPGAALDVRLNGGALAEAGWSLNAGTEQVWDGLAVNGFDMRPPMMLSQTELKQFPTTWAKRLAFGRDPRATYLRGVRNRLVHAEAGVEQVRMAS